MYSASVAPGSHRSYSNPPHAPLTPKANVPPQHFPRGRPVNENGPGVDLEHDQWHSGGVCRTLNTLEGSVILHFEMAAIRLFHTSARPGRGGGGGCQRSYFLHVALYSLYCVLGPTLQSPLHTYYARRATALDVVSPVRNLRPPSSRQLHTELSADVSDPAVAVVAPRFSGGNGNGRETSHECTHYLDLHSLQNHWFNL